MIKKATFLVVAVAVAATFSLSQTTATEAHGVSPAKLSDAGWSCFNVEGLGVHCQPPGATSSATSFPTLVFDTADPQDPHADFLGTEQILSPDVYHDQPCPQHGLDEWETIPEGPLTGYRACHHYE